jgi:hypothetical protein
MISSGTVSNGDRLNVKIAFENHSTSRMKAVEVFFYEHLWFTAQGHSRTRTLEKFHIRIPPEALGAMFNPLSVKPRPAESNDFDILKRLTESLCGGACGTATLPIQGCTSDYQGTLINIRHTIVVRVATPFCVTDPAHEARVFVQAPAPGSPFGMGNSYEIPWRQIMNPPPDWRPQQIQAPPMVQATVIMGGTQQVGPGIQAPVANPISGYAPPNPEFAIINDLFGQLDKSFPLAVCGNLMEWFAIHDDVKTLSPHGFSQIFQHVSDCNSKVRVAQFLSTRIVPITMAHLVEVAQSIRPHDLPDASCTGTRWQVLTKLGPSCVDPQNAELLLQPLNCFPQMVFTPALVQSLFTTDQPRPSDQQGSFPSAPPM